MGAVAGALVGSLALILFVLVSYLRHGGWHSEERVNVVPTIWFYGPVGAITAITLMAYSISSLPTLIGGLAGFLVCAVVRYRRLRAVRLSDAAMEIRYFWP